MTTTQKLEPELSNILDVAKKIKSYAEAFMKLGQYSLADTLLELSAQNIDAVHMITEKVSKELEYEYRQAQLTQAIILSEKDRR